MEHFSFLNYNSLSLFNHVNSWSNDIFLKPMLIFSSNLLRIFDTSHIFRSQYFLFQYHLCLQLRVTEFSICYYSYERSSANCIL